MSLKYASSTSTPTRSGNADANGVLRRGRTAKPWTQVHDWVGLAPGVEPAAHSLYVKLKMFLNVDRGDSVCWPGKDTLAELMGFARADSLDRYLDQLRAVGAIDVEILGVPGRCYYTLHDEPAEAYCQESGYCMNGDRCR